MPTLARRTRGAAGVPWLPAIEMVEGDDEFLLTAELPGMSKKDIRITVENGVLNLEGEKKVEERRAKGRVYVHEREYGAFHRSLTLPKNVVGDEIEADFHDGIVDIHMPKRQNAETKRVEVA